MNYKIYLEIIFFLYLWQLAGYIHIFGHYIFATIFNIKSKIIIPWQRFIPIYGWIWNLYKPHNKMMCKYLTNLDNKSPITRVFIGLSGPYLQLIYIILIGKIFFPNLIVLIGGFTKYALIMCIWQLLYFIGYSIWFHDDKFSDFALLHRNK
jgi:hypothetical protein